MEEPNFFDVFTHLIIYTGYVANFVISIQLMYMPNIERVSPVALNWCLTIVFGLSTLVYFIIQAVLLKIYCHKKNKAIKTENEKKWIGYNFNYTEFAISLFFITFIEYLAEIYTSIEDITGYNQVQLLQIYIFSRTVITGVIFIFSFYLYRKSLDCAQKDLSYTLDR